MHAHTNALRMAGGIQLVDGPSECFGGGDPYVCVHVYGFCFSITSTLSPSHALFRECIGGVSVSGEHQSAVVSACYSVSLSCL